MLRQIWAADNYDVFKQIMVQNNIELQVQALRLMQQRFGIGPAMANENTPGLTNVTGSSQHGSGEEVKEEEALLREVIRLSLDEFKRSESEDYSTELDDAIKSSRVESERLLEEARQEQVELEKALLLSMQGHASDLPPDQTKSNKLPGSNTAPAKAKFTHKAIPSVATTKSQSSDSNPIDTKSLPKLKTQNVSHWCGNFTYDT